MDVHITGKHFEISDRLRAHIEEEAAKLERFSTRIIDCQVFVGTEKRVKEVEVVLKVRAHTLTATSAGASVYQSAEEAMAKVRAQLKKLQDKLRTRRRAGGKRALPEG